MTTHDTATDKGYLNQLADELDNAGRLPSPDNDAVGMPCDMGNAGHVGYIHISDALARQIAARLREIAGKMLDVCPCGRSTFPGMFHDESCPYHQGPPMRTDEQEWTYNPFAQALQAAEKLDSAIMDEDEDDA